MIVFISVSQIYRIKQTCFGVFTLKHLQVWSTRIHNIVFSLTHTVYRILRSLNFTGLG
jgi:hypothetical protein